MLTQLLTETILGAITGYITNDTAIRSLFRPGGVIEQTRDDFAREAGRLLETQVLTPAVLQQQIMRPEVQAELTTAIHAFLREALPKAVQDLRVKDLPEHETTIAELHRMLLKFMQSEQDTLLHYMKKYFPIEALLTEEQCQQFAATLSQVLMDTITKQNLAEQICHSWQQEQDSLQSLQLDSLVNTVIENLAQSSVQWMETLQVQYSAQIKELAVQSIKVLDLEPILLELDKQMEGYTLQQYLNCTETELAQTLYTLLHTQNGMQLLDTLLREVLATVQLIDVSMEQIMEQVIPQNCVEMIETMLKQKLPILLASVLEWVWHNKAYVQRMLEETIEEIALETGGMKGALLQQLKDSFLNEYLQTDAFYQMLQQAISDEIVIAQAVEFLMQKLKVILSEYTVGELVGVLNQTDALHHMLYSLISETLESYLEHGENTSLKAILAWKPGSIHLTAHKDKIEEVLVSVLLSMIERYDPSAWLASCSRKINTMPLQQILSADTLVHLLQSIVDGTCNKIVMRAPQVSSDQVYPLLCDGIFRILEEYGAQELEDFFAQIPVADLVTMLANLLETHTLQPTAQQIQTILQMLQGNLSHLAEDQIQSLSNAEMLQLVEDFMGRELKPLNYLGAGMGALAGATVGMALSTAMPEFSTASPALLTGMIAGKTVTFGAIGYTTNCAAVKGLFWPYEPVAGISMLQGVIPKQKERFAGSMGRLVDRYVINPEILQEQIQQLRDQVQKNQIATRVASDASVWEQLFAILAIERKQLAVPLCTYLAEESVYRGTDKLLAFSSKQISFAKSKEADKDTIKWDDSSERLLSQLSQWITTLLQKEIPLDTFLSADMCWTWFSDYMIEQFTLPDVADKVQACLEQSSSLQNLLGEQYTDITNMLLAQLKRLLCTPQSQQKLERAMASILSSETLFRWLLENIDLWMQKHLSVLFHWGESFLLELLQNRQDVLVTMVEQELLNRMGFMMQTGYAMMNGRDLVIAVVDRILNQKLPIFLSVNQKELELLLYDSWHTELEPALFALQKDCLSTDFVSIDQTMVWNTFEKPDIQQAITQIGAEILQVVAEIPLNVWGRYFNVQELFAKAQLQFGFQWQLHNKEILACWQKPVQSFLADKLHDTTLAQCCKGYHGVVPVMQIVERINRDEICSTILYDVQHAIAETKVEDWCNWEQLVAVLHKDFVDFMKQASVQNWIQYELEVLILQLAEAPDKILPEASRAVWIEWILQAAFSVAEQYGVTLLEQMRLSELAETQLKQMDSAALEQVVRGFAEHYLVHIQNRGWLGALFALPGMLLYFL